MPYDKIFVSGKAHALLAHSGCRSLPVDLLSIARYQRVHALKLGPIVPDGILAPDQDGFTIYLRSRNEYSVQLSEERQVKLSVRQRFTMAHELVHTFFYQTRFGKPELIKDAPRGKRLERLCQFGAGALVVPGNLLRARIRVDVCFSSATQAVELCRSFAVSPEVLLRRIAENDGLLAMDSSIVFAEADSNYKDAKIIACCYHPSLISHLPRPKPFSMLKEWLGVRLGPTRSFERNQRWWHSISGQEGFKFVATLWRQRPSSRFFLEVKFISL